MLQAVYLLCSSKKGISSHQLHRILGIQYNSAWFLTHRIREAFRSGELAPLGGGGIIGQKEDMPKRRGFARKHAILSLVERGGKVRSFHVEGTSAAHLVPILRANIAKEASVMRILRTTNMLITVLVNMPVERFLTELTLDPPDATSDQAGVPLLDEDYLILSTIHSAKGQEWKSVFVLNAVDGCIPSDLVLH
jgi:hypothetical protein